MIDITNIAYMPEPALIKIAVVLSVTFIVIYFIYDECIRKNKDKLPFAGWILGILICTVPCYFFLSLSRYVVCKYCAAQIYVITNENYFYADSPRYVCGTYNGRKIENDCYYFDNSSDVDFSLQSVLYGNKKSYVQKTITLKAKSFTKLPTKIDYYMETPPFLIKSNMPETRWVLEKKDD